MPYSRRFRACDTPVIGVTSMPGSWVWAAGALCLAPLSIAVPATKHHTATQSICVPTQNTCISKSCAMLLMPDSRALSQRKRADTSAKARKKNVGYPHHSCEGEDTVLGAYKVPLSS